jgi:hypothetical protein
MTYILTEQDFQVGAIAKVTNEMRVGLAYESSTWYNLSDELSQKLVSVAAVQQEMISMFQIQD